MTPNSLLIDDRVCPWWLAYTFDNPLRRWIHNPEKILSGLVAPGQTALDIGCGMGYFTLGLARLVGPNGCVIAADLQAEMLSRVQSRAQKAGLQARIRLHRCEEDRIGLHQQEEVDFILAFWMVHETPDQAAFLTQLRALLKPGGSFLLVEPKLHVSAEAFNQTVRTARSVGFTPTASVPVNISMAVLLK